MEAGQRLIVRLVEKLFPPACREEVIGDLCERAKSEGAFIVDALLTLPFVVWSRIRRTTDLAATALGTMGVLIVFKIANREHGSWLAASIPAAAGTLALVFRDAYASEDPRPRAALAAEGLLAMAVAIAVGATMSPIAPRLSMPPVALLFGALYGAILLGALRTTPQAGNGARLATPGGGRADPASLRRQSDRWWNTTWFAVVFSALALAVVVSIGLPSRYMPAAAAAIGVVGVAIQRHGRSRPDTGAKRHRDDD
jgi:hypothetical protein